MPDEESPYAAHMVEHPRPPPIEKKPILPLVVNAASNVDGGSPVPEGAREATPLIVAAEVKKKKASSKKKASPIKAKVMPPPALAALQAIPQSENHQPSIATL